MSLKLRRLSGGRYVIHDSELAIIATEASCLASPCLVGICFDTHRSGWRALERGIADCGYLPDQQHAIDRILERVAEHADSTAHEREVLDAGLANAKRELTIGADIPHKTALALLAHAIGELERLATERQLSAAVNKALPL